MSKHSNVSHKGKLDPIKTIIKPLKPVYYYLTPIHYNAPQYRRQYAESWRKMQELRAQIQAQLKLADTLKKISEAAGESF